MAAVSATVKMHTASFRRFFQLLGITVTSSQLGSRSQNYDAAKNRIDDPVEDRRGVKVFQVTTVVKGPETRRSHFLMLFSNWAPPLLG